MAPTRQEILRDYVTYLDETEALIDDPKFQTFLRTHYPHDNLQTLMARMDPNMGTIHHYLEQMATNSDFEVRSESETSPRPTWKKLLKEINKLPRHTDGSKIVLGDKKLTKIILLFMEDPFSQEHIYLVADYTGIPREKCRKIEHDEEWEYDMGSSISEEWYLNSEILDADISQLQGTRIASSYRYPQIIERLSLMNPQTEQAIRNLLGVTRIKAEEED